MKPTSLFFTLCGDFYRNLEMKVWTGSLIKYMEQFGVSDGLVRVTLSRMAQQGLIESQKSGQKSYYSLTLKGRRRIQDGVTRVYNHVGDPWDGFWRIVFCNTSELEKDTKERFKKELQWSGFGRLGDGTWISPHNRHAQVLSMIEEYDIASHVRLFTARYDGPQSYRDIAFDAWNIAEIEQHYSEFLQRFEPEYQKVFERSLNGTLLDHEAFVYRTLLVHEYRKFLFVDPKLPKELLPTHWIGEEASNFFDRYHQFLSPLAEKFFYSNLVILNTENEGVEAIENVVPTVH